MKLKIWLCLGIGLLCAVQGMAQRFNSYFLKFSGKEVATKDSADVIRLILAPDSGSKYYRLHEYYANYKHKLFGETANVGAGFMVLEGECISSYPNGAKKELATYQHGNKVGDVLDYYPNGTLYTLKRYNPYKITTDSPGVYIKTCNDSTGKALVTDGNGYYIGYSDDFKTIIDEGPVKAGLKDGDWKGTKTTELGMFSYKESFSAGKLISAEYTDNGGKKFTNVDPDVQPSFEGGWERFYGFLGKQLQYPAQAKENRTQGKVIVTFMVNVDGSLSDFVLKRDPGDGLGAEAIRVLKSLPRWIPGKQNGEPTKMEFTIPINFTLGVQ